MDFRLKKFYCKLTNCEVVKWWVSFDSPNFRLHSRTSERRRSWHDRDSIVNKIYVLLEPHPCSGHPHFCVLSTQTPRANLICNSREGGMTFVIISRRMAKRRRRKSRNLISIIPHAQRVSERLLHNFRPALCWRICIGLNSESKWRGQSVDFLLFTFLNTF